MRMSCSGCRVLRKGCSENCSIRPSLQWIKSTESQANATVFLAKFYGRAGLMNLINAGPEHLRPAIFRSLLYEACGRIVNPIYGSVGLLWSGSWQLCQAAVDSVLKGAPIVPIPSEAAASTPAPPFKAYDIRHVGRESGGVCSKAPSEPCKVGKYRTRFKRSHKSRVVVTPPASPASSALPESSGRHWYQIPPDVDFQPARSPENESIYSVETVEASHVSQGEPNHFEEAEVGLELTLWVDPPRRHSGKSGFSCRPPEPAFHAGKGCGVDLQL